MWYAIERFHLMGHYPYTPLQSRSMELGKELGGVTPPICARVPGSVYDDLLRAGLIPDPRQDMNSLACEWVAARWWSYVAEFPAPAEPWERVELVVEGIDNRAHVFLNGEKLGEHEGMFVPAVFDVTKCLQASNVLRIVLESAPDEMGQVGYTSRTATQKPRFAYKWDFGVRLPGIGICGPVSLHATGGAAIRHWHFSYLGGRRARLEFDVDCVRAGRFSARAELAGAGERCAAQCAVSGSGSYALEFSLERPALWQPAGCGEPTRYDLSLRLLEGDGECDALAAEVGLRKVCLRPNPGAPDGARNYTFEVNGRALFVRGVNMVPLDMMYGAVSRERVAAFVARLAELNVNLVRVWGGGLIESEDFYSLCDEAGILVWQDFIQSSSGIDNFPSRRPEFLKLLEEASREAARTKRNHPCLAVFCGGNELMYDGFIPVGEEVEPIGLLAGIVKAECPEIPFLPTTPSGPCFSPDFAHPERNHDVHGQWTYLGPEEHYRYFNELRCLLHSEFGVDGVTNWSAIERSVSPAHRYACDYDEDLFWRHRGEWWNTWSRDCAVFGEAPLSEQWLLSQFLQAEGVRYALEANRRRAPATSGCLLWQADEPFPNGSCTSLIDYYGEPKAAFYAARAAYARVNASLSYRKLIYDRGEEIPVELFLTSWSGGRTVCELSVFADDNERPILGRRYERDLDADRAVCLEELRLPGVANRCLRIELSSEAGGERFRSAVLLLVRGADGLCDRRCCIDFAARLKRGDAEE